MTDHFASTGKVLSGLYAGEQGVGIDVAGNTTLTAGVISSVASREKNHFSTGSLISRNLENVSRWQLESSGFQASLGGAGQGDATGWLGQAGQGMAANSMSLLGGGQNHNEKTASHSALGDNITINTTTVDGDLSRDVAHANGAIDNKFNAQKLQNQMQARTLGIQLVGEIVGTVFQKDQERDDKARAAEGLPPEEAGSAFSPREVARDLIEAGGAAGIAALTGSSDGTLHDSIANMFSSAAAAAGGAVGGLVAGKGSASVSALTGAAAAAAIEQYNDQKHSEEDRVVVKGKRESVAYLVASLGLSIIGMIPIFNEVSGVSSLILDAATGHYSEFPLDLLSLVPVEGEVASFFKVKHAAVALTHAVMMSRGEEHAVRTVHAAEDAVTFGGGWH